jgi:hypothetical protein
MDLIRDYLYSLVYPTLVVTVSVSLRLLYDNIYGINSRFSRKPTAHKIEAGSGCKLIDWIKFERPIHAPYEDLFGISVIAKRVCDLIAIENPASIGILGPYGSGKSSLINLMLFYLQDRKKFSGKPCANQIVLCSIGGWGLWGDGIAKKILSMAIDNVKQYVDCMSIGSLPENYQKALAGGKAWGGEVLSGLVQKATNPISELLKLDAILAASNLKLVIILEDFDRNIGNKELKTEIPALFDRLRNLEKISFVLAIGTTQRYSDTINRICDHVEAIGVLSYNTSSAILHDFIDICLKLYLKDKQVLPLKEQKSRIESLTACSISYLLPARVKKEPLDNICRLAKTPRLLKLILRRTLSIWEKLHGEIDFIDLIIINTLRFGAPEAFSMIIDTISEIRGMELAKRLERDKDAVKAFDTKWDQYCESTNWDATAARELIYCLFPVFIGKMHPSPQNFQEHTPTDYFNRFLAEQIDPSDIPDQELIRSLLDWKKDDRGAHFRGKRIQNELIANKNYCDKFEQFALVFCDGTEMRKLTSLLFEEAIGSHELNASENEMPGFFSLFRMCIRKPVDEDSHINWVSQEIKKALPFSLRFANDIYAYFKANSQDEIRAKQYSPKIREKSIEYAKKVYSSPERFLSAISFDYIYSSYHFVIHDSNQREGGQGFKPEEWKWFADILVEAAEIDRDLCMPQISCILVDRRGDYRDYTHEFNADRAKQLFGDHLGTVLNLLSAEFAIDKLSEEGNAFVKCAREYARHHVQPVLS